MTEDKPHAYTIYEIRFKGELKPRWSVWFEGFELRYLPDGQSLLRGPVRDQAELRGLLEKIGNLNLELISLYPAPLQPGAQKE
ncbi:MAG: hypothetical protein LWX83_14625 [Anaerolineae bacterium]|nr:hypothetical protein [Anaerolineae bacterium]